MCGSLFGSYELRGCAELNREQLRDTLLGHSYAEETVHTRHGHGIMGDGDELGFRLLGHLVEEITIARNIGVIERRVNFVEDTNRGGVG